MQFLSSKSNENIKLLKELFSHKKFRELHQLFPLEGGRLIAEAADSSVEIVAGFATKSEVERNSQYFQKLSESAKEIFEITDSLAHWVADTKSPQGLFAICKMKNLRESIPLSPKGRYLILDGLQDPGNMGTLIRTSLNLGIEGCFITEDSVEVYSPKVIRSSMGGVLKLSIEIVSSASRTIKTLGEAGTQVYAAALTEDAVPLTSALFTTSCAVVIGNEGKGVSREVLEAVEKSVMIPMADGAESLNASVAGGIFLWEMYQGRMLEKE